MRIGRAAMLAATFAGLWGMAAGAAAAQTAAASAPMTIRLVRMVAADCRHDCPPIITLQGVVRTDSHRTLQAILGSLEGRRPIVLVNSPGGDVDAAMAMGRAIRAAGLDVAVGRPAATGGLALETATCSSACTLILAGGVRRLAAPTVRLGVHSMAQSETERVVERVYRRSGDNGREVVSERVVSQRTKPVDAPPEVANRGVAEHLAAMGIGKAFADLTLATPHDRIRVLTPQERLATGIVTQDFDLAAALGLEPR